MVIPNFQDGAEKRGYMIGDSERQALAIRNTDLQSDLLRMRQIVGRMAPRNIHENRDLWYVYVPDGHQLWGPFWSGDLTKSTPGVDTQLSKTLANEFSDTMWMDDHIDSLPLTGKDVMSRFIHIAAKDPDTYVPVNNQRGTVSDDTDIN